MLPQKFSAATTAILVPDPVLEPADEPVVAAGAVEQPATSTRAVAASAEQAR
jgi:hypothetical protein